MAGIVHHLGVPVGEKLMGAGFGNPVGYFEDMEFYNLHRLVLGEDRNPRAWRHPVPDLEAFREPYQALVNARNRAHPRWGVKDPRLCFILPLLLEAHHAEVRVIRVHRDPLKSAQSLSKREGDLSVQDAEVITRSYHQAARESAELAVQRGPVLHLHFDFIVANPRQAVEEVARFVRVPESEMEDRMSDAAKFVDPSLDHWRSSL